METYFAPPGRASNDQLTKEFDHVTHNPVIDSLLNTIKGLIAVLNDHRQIITLNMAFLKAVGVEDAKDALGLRPGEFVGCIHAHDMPGGCGTSEHCITCGAAISIVSSLKTNEPAEEKCVLTIEKEGKTEELFLKVRAAPLYIDNERFLLLFLNDITKEQQSANIERLFFHDINNIVFAIQGRAELLSIENEEDRLSSDIFTLSRRLSKEIEIQRCLALNSRDTYTPVYQPFPVRMLLEDIENIFSTHPAATAKSFTIDGNGSDIELQTDYSLLLRILVNMVTNALEASEKGDQVRLTFTLLSETSITFSIWNPLPIPEAVQKRIFQRNFSTKSDVGRGIGTYAMKFFGESVLKGSVSFRSSPEEGTYFQITLPLFS